MVVPPTALNLLRRELRTRREDFVRDQPDVVFKQHSAFSSLLVKAQCLGLYIPMIGEPDPWSITDIFRGVRALPSLSINSPPMKFQQWFSGETLIDAKWGGSQPAADAPERVPDLIIVPLLGFDAAFNRIGQGGGYYDRYLAAYPSACRVGLAWDVQRVTSITARSWDVPLDAVLTETAFCIKDLTRCQNR